MEWWYLKGTQWYKKIGGESDRKAKDEYVNQGGKIYITESEDPKKDKYTPKNRGNRCKEREGDQIEENKKDEHFEDKTTKEESKVKTEVQEIVDKKI